MQWEETLGADGQVYGLDSGAGFMGGGVHILYLQIFTCQSCPNKVKKCSHRADGNCDKIYFNGLKNRYIFPEAITSTKQEAKEEIVDLRGSTIRQRKR